ncbi:MAG: PEGA domain-containing protein, partial [Candidatus Heimdallarchaeaceae archaeon]
MPTAMFYGRVLDADTKKPIVGASVDILGLVLYQSIKLKTLTTGTFYTTVQIPSNRSQVLQITINASGYEELVEQITIPVYKTYVSYTFLLKKTEVAPSPPKKYRVYGKIYQVPKGGPLEGVLVKADTGESTTTGSDGSFSFLVTEGRRRILFIKKGFQTIESTLTIDKDFNFGEFNMYEVILLKQATLKVDTFPVKGRIYLDGKDIGVAPQEVTVLEGMHTIVFDKVEGYEE